jgi:predicted aldo/keto reductase-like oxidoreductase
MLYRNYGKTNEKVSVLGFGCMRLPIIEGVSSNIDEEQAMAMIHHAINEGVNYIDTAYPYHGDGSGKAGKSEPFVAKVLKNGYRKKVKIATKLPSWLVKTREDMDKFLNEQLERLETEYIDFYLVHALNRNRWDNLKEAGIVDFLDRAIKDGRIKYAGFSFHDNLPVFKEIVDSYDWSFCQIQYNYLDEFNQAGKEGLEYAANKGLGIAIMEPLRGGKIANNLPQDVLNIFNSTDIKRTPAEWALKWVWDNPQVSLVLSGMNNMDQVVENLKIAKEAKANILTNSEIAIIDEVKDIFKNRIKVNCTSCEYCMPCPAGVNIPQNFKFYNNSFLFDNPDSNAQNKEKYKKAYLGKIKEENRASACVECGKCEEHCPQFINIRDALKSVKNLFE